MVVDKYRNIRRFHRVLVKGLTETGSSLTYSRLLVGIEKLAELIRDTDTDETVWNIGEFTVSLDALIVGSYWYMADYHGGQWSDEYRAMCTLGQIFSPGGTSGPEPDSAEEMVYQAWESL